MIGIASDHAGFDLKNHLITHLQETHHTSRDFGPETNASTHYPLFAQKLCKSLLKKEITRGILICGTGIGMSIAANRFNGIRAALCLTPEMARLSRQHNDANILVLGARLISPETADELCDIFLNTPFEAGRHLERLTLIEDTSS